MACTVIAKSPIEPVDNQWNFLVTGDPSSAGLTAGIGSTAVRQDLSGRDLYTKTGSGDTAWTRLPLLSTADSLTALAGGAQAGTALSAAINRVTTVASAADSVQLPVSVAGRSVVVVNAAAANAMAVFPQTGDAINALAANASLSVAANKTVLFYCTAAGRWHSILTA
jgi:hypothetical protein